MGKEKTDPARTARRNRQWLVFFLVLASGGVIAYGRLALGLTIVSTHFAYLPIVLAGLWWGRRAVLVALFFAALIFSLEVFAETREPWFADVGRTVFFVLVALAVGVISEKASAALAASRAAHTELESAQQKLVEADRLASMGQLSAGVAHELNNPLGSILIYARLVEKQLQAGDPALNDVRVIVGEARRCKDIVRALLDFARQSNVSKVPTDVAALLDEVAALASPRAQAGGVSIRVEAAQDLPPLMLDRAQIKQVLVNLVDNALDAADEAGHVVLAAAPAHSRGMVDIRVTDDGGGIPPENLSKLFTPFFTTKEANKGTGLGLAIAYGIVKMHSGRITAESEPGKGTTFTVSIPTEVSGE